MYLKLFTFYILLFVHQAFGVHVATTSPQTTELLVQLGKRQNLAAGITVQGMDIKGDLPSLGALFVPSLERLVRLAPDWVIVDTSWSDLGLRLALHGAGIPQLNFNATDAESFFTSTHEILTQIFGERENARLSLARRCFDQIKPPNPPETFIALTWIDPPILFGKHTFLGGMLARILGTPLAPDLGPAYPQVSVEWMITHQPDRVYFLDEDGTQKKAMQNAAKKWWPTKSPRLIALNPNWFSRASLTPFQHLNSLFADTNPLVTHDCAI